MVMFGSGTGGVLYVGGGVALSLQEVLSHLTAPFGVVGG